MWRYGTRKYSSVHTYCMYDVSLSKFLLRVGVEERIWVDFTAEPSWAEQMNIPWALTFADFRWLGKYAIWFFCAWGTYFLFDSRDGTVSSTRLCLSQAMCYWFGATYRRLQFPQFSICRNHPFDEFKVIFVQSTLSPPPQAVCNKVTDRSYLPILNLSAGRKASCALSNRSQLLLCRVSFKI